MAEQLTIFGLWERVAPRPLDEAPPPPSPPLPPSVPPIDPRQVGLLDGPLPLRAALEDACEALDAEAVRQAHAALVGKFLGQAWADRAPAWAAGIEWLVGRDGSPISLDEQVDRALALRDGAVAGERLPEITSYLLGRLRGAALHRAATRLVAERGAGARLPDGRPAGYLLLLADEPRRARTFLEAAVAAEKVPDARVLAYPGASVCCVMVVRYEQQGNIAIVTLDDGKANALSFTLMDEAQHALARATQEAAAVVLTGRAGRFSAGFDLREMMAGAEKARSLVARGVDFLMGLYALPVPLVVACSGHAVAGGALVVLTGDVRFGVDGPFKIGLNEVQIGMPLPILAIELARDRLRSEHLTRATLHSELADPTTALAWGFLDEVVAPDVLVGTAVARAVQLAALPRDAFAKSKVALRERTIRYIRETLAEDMRRLTPPAAR